MPGIHGVWLLSDSNLWIPRGIKRHIMSPYAQLGDGRDGQVPRPQECLINSLSWQIGAGRTPPYASFLTAQREPPFKLLSSY